MKDNEKMENKNGETSVLRKKKLSKLEKYKEEIKEYLEMGISVASICKLLNKKHNLDYVYTTYIHYVKNILKS